MIPPARGVWLLTGPRCAEVAQQRVLAGALGLPVMEKPVHITRSGRRFGWHAGLAHDCGLVPPWPTAVLSFGKTLDAALWVRQASGGTTRLVHLGRPRGVHLDRIDVLIPMPQDCVPRHANVQTLRMPLNRPPTVDASRDAVLLERLSALPAPRIALLLGGPTPHFTMTVAEASLLVRQAGERATARGGSLLLSTSPRTPPDWIVSLRGALPIRADFHVYGHGDEPNPMAAYLALADELVVSGDSASMIVECWRSGKPVHVWRPKPARRLRDTLRARWIPSRIEDGLIARGLWAPRVDLPGWLASVADQGLIGLFGHCAPRRVYCADEDDELMRVAARIRALLRE